MGEATYPEPDEIPDGTPETLVPWLVDAASVSVSVLVLGLLDGSGDVTKLVWVTVW
jgi:hypothetical protein